VYTLYLPAGANCTMLTC